MSNTVTSLNATMIMEEVLPALKLGLLPINGMSKRLVSDKPLFYGDSVNVDIVSTKTAGAYSTTFASGNSTATGTSVKIGAPQFSSWHINPYLEGQPTAERFLAHGREAAYAVAKTVLQSVTNLFVASNIGNTAADKLVVTTANYDTDVFADARKLLLDKSVSGPIMAIHNIAYASQLMKDDALKNVEKYGSNQVIATGVLPSIFGITPYYTDAFSSTLTDENTGVIFTGPETAAIAIGAAGDPTGQEGAAGVRSMDITDPETGLSFTWRTWVDANTGWHWGSVYLAYGVAFLRKSAVRVVSA